MSCCFVGHPFETRGLIIGCPIRVSFSASVTLIEMLRPNGFADAPNDLALAGNDKYPSSWILAQVQQGHTLKIDTHSHNGLILCKPFHADFAGPGATIGGAFDLDCQQVIAVGDLSVQSPSSHDDSQKG